MAERSNAAVLKTVDCYRSGGSNPSLSALISLSLGEGGLKNYKACKINDLQAFCFLGIPAFAPLYGYRIRLKRWGLLEMRLKNKKVGYMAVLLTDCNLQMRGFIEKVNDFAGQVHVFLLPVGNYR